MSERIMGKLAALENTLRGIAASLPGGGVAVAYSGGLDSRFLVHMAVRARLPVRALHANGPHIPAAEHAEAVQWARDKGVDLAVLPLDPLAMPALRNNPRDRCYHCKKAVFTSLREAAGSLPLCDGTNASDSDEYRPGLKALAELGILSPLAMAGMTKEDIRLAGAATGLDNPGQAARPCLLTRFGYGAALSAPLLRRVDAAEEAVRKAFREHGNENPLFRIRYEDAAAFALHLESRTLAPGLEKDLDKALAASGMPGAPIRLLRSLSGYFDRPLQNGA